MSDGVARDGLKAGDLVVVTGGGGGFGRALSLRFARDGAKVAVWEVNRDSGEETARQVREAGGEARFFPVDLSQPAEIEAAAAAVLDAYGAPYCVINNASIYPRASVLDMSGETFERTLRVNVTAPFLVVKAFGRAMIAQRRGVVINISSTIAMQGAAGGANYASSKGALLSFTKSLALEWAQHNIRCNSILPGVAFTAQPLEATSAEELLERGRRTIPLGRVGYPDDVAGLAAFLASADAAYMTGQGLAMNGGRVFVP
ncbi:MAG: 3-oxoacyl-[acyl-carrier protein] reductase [Hyphomicrobiales bacterium]|nr:3-oxoacyl-[acyl-carrier protein] reductase [Hyphomicrobiales bacterium]